MTQFLELHDSTETLIRNVVALEQSHYKGDTLITDYYFMLDLLINTAKTWMYFVIRESC